MTTSSCERCGASTLTLRAGARFCSTKCRVYASRAAKRAPKLPVEIIDRAPAKMPVLYVHDDLVSVLSGSAGTGVVGIRVKGQPEVYGGTAISSRYTDHKEAGGSIRMFTFSPSDQIEFVLRSTAVSAIKVCGAVTYGWGLPPALA